MAFPFLMAAAQAPAGSFKALDWDWMDSMGLGSAYADMSYLCEVGSGIIISTATYSAVAEGNADQTVCVLRSLDGGRTWLTKVDLEVSSGPEASWGVPYYHAASGKLFVFYVYNFEDVRSITDNDGVGSTSRVDSIGKIAYRVSTDNGATFGSRTLIDLTAKAVDNRNPYSGSKQLLWLYGRVVEYSGSIYFGFSKCGEVDGGNQYIDTEAFVLRIAIDGSGNLTSPTQLPSGGSNGIRNSGGSDITEEPDVIVHSDGVISVIARSDQGVLTEAYSTDAGATFTVDTLRRTDGTTTLPQTRGPAILTTLPDDSFLLTFYNSAIGSGFSGRNPYWYAIGARVGNRLRFGTPYAFMFNKTGTVRLNYGSVLPYGDELLVAMTNKIEPRIGRVPLPPS